MTLGKCSQCGYVNESATAMCSLVGCPLGGGPFARECPARTPVDLVNHPPHYQSNGMEAIEVIEAFGLGFNLGNAVKYVLRSGRKGDTKEDLAKAAWYLQREIERLGK
jgi:Protein of unknwon function (DUF3310)